MHRANKPLFLNRDTPPHIGTLIFLAGVSGLGMNMFLPSLPQLSAHYGVSYAYMQLSVPFYLGMSAILQVVFGPLSDQRGRRRVMLWGLALFTLFSLGCVFAPTAEVFLLCRTGQAAAAVGMVLGRAVIRDLYEQDQAASMIGYVTMGMALVPMVAPMFGGWLDEAFGWQSVFWAYVLVGAAGFGLTWFDQGETAVPSGKTIVGQFREYPELLRSPRFWGYALAAAFCSGAFFSYLGGAPFVGSVVFGLSPAWLGFYFGAPAVGYAIGNMLTGLLARRYGINRLILIGCTANAAGVGLSLLIFILGAGSAESFFGLMTFVGLGNGLVVANATAGLLSVRPRLAGSASGLGGAIMIGGGAALSALAGSMLSVQSGALPLLWLQFTTGLCAIASIGFVFWRERQLLSS